MTISRFAFKPNIKPFRWQTCAVTNRIECDWSLLCLWPNTLKSSFNLAQDTFACSPFDAFMMASSLPKVNICAHKAGKSREKLGKCWGNGWRPVRFICKWNQKGAQTHSNAWMVRGSEYLSFWVSFTHLSLRPLCTGGLCFL